VKAYNPFLIDRPKIALGELGEFELGEIHESRQKKISGLLEKFHEVSDDDDSTMDQLAGTIGDILEAVCINGDGVKEFLVDKTDVEKHSENAIGVQTLKGIVRFILDYVNDELSSGEE
jgi:hypothetical protein